jgi:hypothetical protein
MKMKMKIDQPFHLQEDENRKDSGRTQVMIGKSGRVQVILIATPPPPPSIDLKLVSPE